MYQLHTQSTKRQFIGSDYESIVEEWQIYDPQYTGSFGIVFYTEVRQQTSIGALSANWRTYSRQGMRTWDDNVKNKEKKKIIEEVKIWFAQNGIPWQTIES